MQQKQPTTHSENSVTVQQHCLQGNVVQQINHSLITTRTPPGNKAEGQNTPAPKHKQQTTPTPNNPFKRRTQVQPGTHRDDELIDSTKQPNEYIRQKPLT